MMTPPPDMDADGFCRWLRNQIAKVGPEKLFYLNGYLVLYSGPLKEFQAELEKNLSRPVRWNKERAINEAAEHGTHILDYTPLGEWLRLQNFEVYFDKVCNSDSVCIRNAEFQVWATASEELVKAAFGKAMTAVCGADPERIFLLHELPQIIKETNLDTINYLPIELVQELGKLDITEAFQMVAKFELLSWHIKAKQAADPKEAEKTRQEWRERYAFYKRSLAKAHAARPAHSPAELSALSLRRRDILSRYDLKAAKAEIVKNEELKRTLLTALVPMPTISGHCHH